MDAKHKVIKVAVEKHYAAIKDANEWLTELRKRCGHPIIEIVGYEWAPGHVDPNVKVCGVCGEKIHDPLQNIHIQDSDQSI